MRNQSKKVVALVLALLLTACSQPNEFQGDKADTVTDEEELDISQKEKLILDSVEHYSAAYFRFLENVRINITEEGMCLFVEFVPEVGSFPVKEEIYQTVVFHAMQVNSFFQEIEEFHYDVLWDDNTKQKAMELIIRGDEVSNLSDVYYEQCTEQNAGFETAFKNAFSEIVETDESMSWR